MGRMIEGEWYPNADKNRSDDTSDEYVREETSFRDWIGTLGTDDTFPAEAGRYHLYISQSCPWAHRTTLVRALRGLEDVISIDIVDPVRGEDGWEFTPEKEGCTPDTVNGCSYLRDVYRKADSAYTGGVTVPVLWDIERETIVNNESAEIMRMLDVSFADFGHEFTLYPEGYREKIDQVIDSIYDSINNGVYQAGFAESQAAYERAVTDLFDALDRYEELLATQRYLCGEVLTEADICLFTTLFRFDTVYYTHFKCNVRRLVDYPNLWNYTKELAQFPGVARTLDVAHVKTHYYRGQPELNPTGFVPVGPELDLMESHDRDDLPGGPPAALTQ
ncbi:glutathione S-transferase family protein [Salinibaculum salinum]|uniref:glutathione S-transferase family protein n=1 Tax=Salinibaculum salinum TaxID=3131996 RepID=UPI0030EE2FA0